MQKEASTNGRAMVGRTLDEALVGYQAFANRDALVAALKQCSYTTVNDLASYDGRRLKGDPPDAASVTALLGECAGKDATIKDETPWRTALGHVLTAAFDGKATSNDDSHGSDERDRRAAQAFAKEKYDNLGKLTGAMVPASHRLDAKIVKRAYEDLDSGTLSKDCYALGTLHSALDTSVDEETAHVGGIPVDVKRKSNVPLAKAGDVLMQIWKFCKMMLAAGYRAIPDGSEIAGDHGKIRINDPTDPTKKKVVQYHLTVNR